ncbi:MAG TPA: Fe-S oxidoreductase, partial [Actinoplanes sp.]|nr:Fe-S oxidoreductase [Actinoplanes sp.]
MGIAQIVATVLAGAVTITAVVLAVRAVLTITSVIRQGQPAPERFTGKGTRTTTMLRETLGHTRMLKWSAIGAAHWFVMVSFLILFLLVVEAYFEVVDPEGGLPVIGHWLPYGLVTEWIGILGLAGIGYLVFV